jgi:hypothetical protein
MLAVALFPQAKAASASAYGLSTGRFAKRAIIPTERPPHNGVQTTAFDTLKQEMRLCLSTDAFLWLTKRKKVLDQSQNRLFKDG